MGASNVKATAYKQKAEEYPQYQLEPPYWCMMKEDVAKIHLAKSGPGSGDQATGGIAPTTVIDVLAQAAKKWPDAPALAVERPVPQVVDKVAPDSLPRDQWKTWTYSEYLADVRAAAKGMMKLGAVRYDGVNILGFNSPEWFMAELAAMCFGGKAAGIYPTDTPEQTQYKTELADGAIACVDSKSSFDKFAKMVDRLPYLKAIITWDYPDAKDVKRTDGSTVKVMTWDQLVEMGKAESDDKINQLLKETKPGNCAVLVFTSGTTGHPKAVMLSHDSLIYEAYTIVKHGVENYGLGKSQERILSYLPLSHVAGMMVDIMAPICTTAFLEGYCTTYFARSYDLKIGTIGKRMVAVRPTIFLGVPRVWEKIAEKMKSIGATLPDGFKKSMATWAKGVMLDHQINCQVGGNGKSKWGYSVASKLLFKVKEALGLDECKFCVTGAAPISRDTLEYFGSIGIQINEVYGMSESTGAVTFSSNSCHLWGSIGFEVPGSEVKILTPSTDGSEPKESQVAKDFFAPTEAEQGEVCFRGRNIMMGYLCNPKLGPAHVEELKQKNMESIDNHGWLHSGDKGSKDSRGMYRITGRYKELIITAGGENIAPVPIEDNIKVTCPMVSNVMMIGDKRKFNVCVVTLKAVGATGEKPGTDELDPQVLPFVEKGVTTISAAMRDQKLIKAITDGITKTNNNGDCCPSNASKIQKFCILPLDFSVETEDLTPSLKLKRAVVEGKYDSMITKIYESKDTYVMYSA